MAKNRKTRKEKIRASQRLTSASSTTASEPSETASESRTTYSFSSDSPIAASTRGTTETALTSHLREDLLRTGIVTGAIILAELILFYTLSFR
jgi:hypothetical protein